MSTQETDALTATYARDGAADRVLGVVHEILARRSVPPPARAILPDDDLRDAGLTSIDMVNLMLAVEAEFDITIKAADIIPENFLSIATIEALIARIARQ